MKTILFIYLAAVLFFWMQNACNCPAPKAEIPATDLAVDSLAVKLAQLDSIHNIVPDSLK